MTSQPIRDPLADHLITPQNAALVLIDYQPSQFGTVRSMDPELLRKNIISTVRAARAFGLPIVHSTVNVTSGQQEPTVPDLAERLEASPPMDPPTAPRSTARPSTHGRTPTSWPPCVPPGGASSSSARCGPRSAWRSRPSTR